MAELTQRAAGRNAGQRWAPHVVESFTPVSDFFLAQHTELVPAIKPVEAMVIIHLMSFKWTEEAPFPAFKTLGKRMGMSPTAVRTHVRNLEANGYLKRDMRVGTTNVFHLTPLFEKLEERRAQVEAQPSRRRKRRLKVAESEADE